MKSLILSTFICSGLLAAALATQPPKSVFLPSLNPPSPLQQYTFSILAREPGIIVVETNCNFQTLQSQPIPVAEPGNIELPLVFHLDKIVTSTKVIVHFVTSTDTNTTTFVVYPNRKPRQP